MTRSAEVQSLLNAELAKYRERPYAELIAMIGDEDHPAFDLEAPSGVTYWVEVEAFWDGGPADEVVRVRAAVCGGDISYNVPECDDFLKRSDGRFIGE